MNDRAVLSEGHSRTSVLALLERARELARQGQPTSSDCTIESTALGGGDKGEKPEKPPSASREQALPTAPDLVVQSDDPAVAWRVQAMWKQVQPARPLPFLVAREVAIRDGACLSCDAPLAEGDRYRCALCLKAATLVVASLRSPR